MDSTYKTYHDTDTYENYATGLLNKILVSFFNCLSLLGTFLIIASYIKWKDIRTTSRKILVFLSISDFLVSAGYLVGNFLPKKTKENENACIAQSFITSSASIISFMWSASLAIYLHFTLVQNRRSFANKLVSVFHVTNWLTGPTINIIATDQKVLGSSADDVTAGWCWILHYSDPEKRYKEILWMLFDGKFWEILTAALIVVFYISVKLKIRKELKEQKLRRGNVALGPAVLRAARAADKKLMFVPMLFILCRIWGTIRFLIFWAGALPADNSRLIHKILLSLQAVGDSSQGFVNCILFCFLTPKVCNHLTEAFWQICGCCLGHQNSKYKAIKAIDSSSGLKNSSTTCMGEKSSLFHSSIGSVSTYGIYPTLN